MYIYGEGRGGEGKKIREKFKRNKKYKRKVNKQNNREDKVNGLKG